MPVFDFNNTPDKDKPLTCTYTTFRSDESTATPERPMLVLDVHIPRSHLMRIMRPLKIRSLSWITVKRSGITIPVGFSRIRVSRLLLNLMKTEER